MKYKYRAWNSLNCYETFEADSVNQIIELCSHGYVYKYAHEDDMFRFKLWVEKKYGESSDDVLTNWSNNIGYENLFNEFRNDQIEEDKKIAYRKLKQAKSGDWVKLFGFDIVVTET